MAEQPDGSIQAAADWLNAGGGPHDGAHGRDIQRLLGAIPANDKRAGDAAALIRRIEEALQPKLNFCGSSARA